MVGKNLRILTIVHVYLVVFLTFGCATGKAGKQTHVVMEIQEPPVVEKTVQNNRPVWISEKPYFEDDKGYHFTGGIIGGADYALTIRLAKAEATKNLLESIQIKARGEFSTAVHGQNQNNSDLGRYVTDAVAWTIDGLLISGIRQKKIYCEQISDPVAQTIKYNSWVQLEISRIDYQNAKIDAAQRLLDKAIQEKDEEAKNKALELLDKLRQEV